MKLSKALEILKHQLACEKENDYVCGGYCEECQHHISDEDWIAALNIAISALEKQNSKQYVPDPWDGIKPHAPDGFVAKYCEPYQEKK